MLWCMMVLETIGAMLRMTGAIVAGILVVDAIVLKQPALRRPSVRALRSLIAPLKRPVGIMLPTSLSLYPYDYTPLVTALLVLLTGMGAGELFDMLAEACIRL